MLTSHQADLFRHEIRRPEDGIEARHNDEHAAGELLGLLDAFENAEGHHHHNNGHDHNYGGHNTETTVTEILKETVTAAAASSNSTVAPVTVTLNGTAVTSTANANV